MKLSILIPSLEERAEQLNNLRAHIAAQIGDRHHLVEVITYVDNKQRTTGYKRQRLLEESHGEYIVFIDDDDWIENYYVNEMLIACDSGADCFAINGYYSVDGGVQTRWRISKNYDNIDTTENGQPMLLRRTNHITAVKKIHAMRAGFPDKSNAEDKYYSDRVYQFCNTEYVIEKPLYHYRYSSKNKSYK